MPIVLLLCLVGVYSINNAILDVWLMIGFGLLGYVMRKLKYDSAPLVLALVLGPMMERSFREAMMISRGNLAVFVTRPISATLLIVGVAVMVVPPVVSGLRARTARRMDV
jgi:putative tricarboxylic transport membrane protein